MGTHLRVLSESYPLNTNMTGFRWFPKGLHSCALEESSLSTGRVKPCWILSPRGLKNEVRNQNIYHLRWPLSGTELEYIGRSDSWPGYQHCLQVGWTSWNRKDSTSESKHLIYFLSMKLNLPLRVGSFIIYHMGLPTQLSKHPTA